MLILPVIFCLGVFSIFAQMLFLREMLVAFFGSELSIGAILGSWLTGIAVGAFSGRVVLARLHAVRRVRGVVSVVLLVLALLLPAQVYAIRVVRRLLEVGVGEYAPLGSVLGSALLIFLPTCWVIGFCFPCACRVLAAARGVATAGGESAPGAIYTMEAAGSMCGGVVLSFVLLPLLSVVQIVALACVAATAGAACAASGRGLRIGIGVLSAALFLAALCPPCLSPAERAATRARWRAFGVLPDATSADPASVRLVVSADSIYQNLAIFESHGQYSVYGNGHVLFSFPDPLSYEHAVHFVMAQKPAARRVLLLGGNPVGEIPELLRYGPVTSVVYVELDPLLARLLARIVPDRHARVMSDGRVRHVTMDAARFVRRCRETFDVVLVHAPDPTSAALNRFYTREFFANVRRLLAPNGFMYTTVSGSERLQAEAAEFAASVYRTLREVFPVVLVTAGSEAQFFAGQTASGLTFDRQTLYERSRSAAVAAEYFRPEYFLGADEIAPDKTAVVRSALAAAAPPVNTVLRPLTYYYNLVLWSRFSGSGVASLLQAARRIRFGRLGAWCLVGGCLCLAVGFGLRRGVRAARSAAAAHWSRLMVTLVIATTGLSAMALELVLVFVFQNLYGYVYTRMGLIVATFMMGLVLGAPSGKAMARRLAARAWLALLGLEAALVFLPLGIRALAVAATGAVRPDGVLRGVELLFYAIVALLGWLVGAQFPLGNRLFCDAGGTVQTAAGITDAADHLGAAVGCFALGVVLVPVLGVGPACVLLAALKGASLLCLLSGRLAGGGC